MNQLCAGDAEESDGAPKLAGEAPPAPAEAAGRGMRLRMLSTTALDWFMNDFAVMGASDRAVCPRREGKQTAMSAAGGSRPPGLQGSAILHAHDEAQAGPDVVDRAHLVVDQPLPETDLAHDVLVEVGGYAGSSLGPCDPEAASRIEGSAQPAELLRQPGPRSEERHDHVGLAARPGNHAERAREPFGRGDEAHAAMLLDAKLLRQGRSRVAGHSSSVPGTLVRGKRACAAWCHPR